MGWKIDCTDGVTVRGETVEELRANAQQHVAEMHQGEDLDFEAVMASAQEE
jgi:predicted RNase H-like HicB family nuclease